MKAYKVLKGYFQSLPEKVCFQQPNVALGTLRTSSACLSWVLLPHKGI